MMWLAAAPSSVWKVVRCATSHRVTRFPGVAVVTHDVPCSKFPVGHALMPRHALFTTASQARQRSTGVRMRRLSDWHVDTLSDDQKLIPTAYRVFTLVTVLLVTWTPRDFGPRTWISFIASVCSSTRVPLACRYF